MERHATATPILPTARDGMSPGAAARTLTTRHSWIHGEPPVGDLLADPIVQLLMRRDGVVAEDLLTLIDDARKREKAPKV